MIETISAGDVVLCYIIRSQALPAATTFYAPESSSLQVGHVVHSRDHEIAPHFHIPVQRNLTATAEVLFVHTGSSEIDLYDLDQQLVASRELKAGDIVVLLAGGHGFRMIE